MINRIFGSLACLAVLACTAFADSPAKQTFERLKKLAGTWKGQASGTEVEVTYKVTGAGSAVVETQFPGTQHEMVTVYHLDGEKLLLTHYCAAQNQPRMRLMPGKDSNVARFSFVSVTNLKPKAMYAHNVTVRFLAPDHIVSEWTFYSGGKSSGTEKFDLKRVS